MAQPQQFESTAGTTGFGGGQQGFGGGAVGQQGIGQGSGGQPGPGQQSGLGQQQGGQPGPGQQQGGQQGIGQQQGGQQRGGPQSFEASMTGPMRLALHDFVESTTVCDWCADQCIDEGPQMAECIRLCRDVSDLGALNVRLLSRQSRFGSAAARLFVEAAEECARECARHPHAHCQECASVLSRATDSTRKLLDSVQQQGSMGVGQAQSGLPQQGWAGQGGQSGPRGGFGQPGQGQSGQQGQFGQQPGIGQSIQY